MNAMYFIAPQGFREYDARWLHPEQLNLRGAQKLGLGIATLIHEIGKRRFLSLWDMTTAPTPLPSNMPWFWAWSKAAAKCLTSALPSLPLLISRSSNWTARPWRWLQPPTTKTDATGVKIGAERPMTFQPN